jgi:hypothetical protein
VTNIRPSGMNSSAHGRSSPRATVSTVTTPLVEPGVAERCDGPSCGV